MGGRAGEGVVDARGFSFALSGPGGGLADRIKQGEAGDEEDEYGEYGYGERGSGSEEDDEEGPRQGYEAGFQFENAFENYF